MKALIVGAGDVGSRIAQHLQSMHEVVTTRRTGGDLAVDVSDPTSVARLPTDIHLVAVTVAAGSRDAARYRSVYLDGMVNVVDHLIRHDAPVERFLFTSSTAVYGTADGSWLAETDPAIPTSETGRIVLEAEDVLRASPYREIIVRLAGIYGPGRTRLIDSVRTGTARIPAGPEWTNRIHAADAAGLCAHLLTMPDPPRTIIGVDDEPADRAEVLRWLADQAGVAEPPGSAPEPGSDVRSARGSGANKRLRNDLLHATGYRLRYPTFRDGYAELL